MYFDLMGPHFIIAIRSCLENDWYEALEYHWLALFNMVVYVMKFGWNLQRAEEQKRARNLSSKSAAASWSLNLICLWLSLTDERRTKWSWACVVCLHGDIICWSQSQETRWATTNLEESPRPNCKILLLSEEWWPWVKNVLKQKKSSTTLKSSVLELREINCLHCNYS